MRTKEYILLIAVLLCGCTKSGEPDTPDSGTPIMLSAGVAAVTATTRTQVTAQEYGGEPSVSHPLEAAVWLSKVTNVYNSSVDAATNLPNQTFAMFKDDDLTFTYTQSKYPDDNSPAYAVGFYPATGWTLEGASTAKHNITGADDLMFASEISATKTNQFSTSNHLSFNHLLTWLKIRVIAEDLHAISSWGKLSHIKIDTQDNISIDLTNNEVSYGGTTTEISAFESATGVDLHTYAQEEGSVFCSPATSYNIKVKTAHLAAEKQITVDLKDLSGNDISAHDAKGKIFIITLYFNSFNLISATCTLDYWDDVSERLYPTTP